MKAHILYFTTWQRYFYKQFLLATTCVLFALFGLYIIIDIMAHIHVVAHKYTTWTTTVEYYAATFSKRLDVLLPFAILIATIRTLFSFQIRGELVALLASGISKKVLVAPFIIVAIFASSLLYINYEYVYPYALPRIDTIYESHFGKTDLEKKPELLPREVMLTDGSKLIYSRYNAATQEFHNVFWIISTDRLFHIKRLKAYVKEPEGRWVDEIVRLPNGELSKKNSYPQLLLKDLQIDGNDLKSSMTPSREQPLSQLLKQSVRYAYSASTRGAEIKSQFIYKITSPLLCILAVLAVAPFCLRFSRQHPLLMTYLVAIAGLFCMNLLFEAAFVVGKSELISPFAAFFFPWICLSYIFGKKYLET